MPAASMVEVAERSNGAPDKWDIEVVDMLARYGLRPEIDRHGREDDLLKVVLEVRIVGTDGVEGGTVELIEAGCEELERSWALASARVAIAE